MLQIVRSEYGKETLEIKYLKGEVLLEKAKQEVNIEEFLASAREAMPDVSIVTKACSQNEIYDYEIPKKRLAEFDMQDKRIDSGVKSCRRVLIQR